MGVILRFKRRYITSVVDVRDEMRKLLNQQPLASLVDASLGFRNDHLLKAIGENYSGKPPPSS